MSTLETIPARLASLAPVLVVAGDAILDRWWIGTSARLSREAPAPVVDVTERRTAAGGAANAALNAAAMGARVRFVGIIGADAAGDEVVHLLRAAGVDCTGALRRRGVVTTVKTRIVADDQVLVRADETHASGGPAAAVLASTDASERGADLGGDLGGELADALAAALDGAEAMLVSDYGGPLLVPAVEHAVAVRRPAHVVVDAHEPAHWRGIRPDVVVPNALEAAALVRETWPAGRERLDAVTAAADRLLDAAGAEHMVVTLDRDGTVVLRRGAAPLTTFAHPVAEKFASGAGDTFAAALTAALAIGAPIGDSAGIAQCAADVVVRALGTSVCSAAALAAEAGTPRPAILTSAELAHVVARDRDDGLRIVFTNGCFDVLHLGHTSYLREAKRLGDRLVVAVNADASVRRLKGPGRPVNDEIDRAGVVAALECVDYVTLFDADTPIALIEALRPDLYVKGGDYTPDMLEETPAVRAYGGEVRTVGYVEAHSTSAVVDRIRSQSGEPS
ncbi:D-glycero-beta-D-manno-heptose 1-phosphate adenylyltransferase [Agromyces aerolatus]|uniref:D-glycero-beta-D-manno-heptose 1-phosphate adenylyltransferase n=1 Tax=Agromyces sp. LY-1074 TaxID=3074080 RepID=UPI0028549B62|nr:MULTISPECIES: D-glycero-beta-D-manno-heptose 1-phosphate adenylyltransferase [unclassified Agromyces]MDR5700582.1 D-glycero-beta-D-manno-heptose 1-phosphate adenylyltransferase [Agromyces sp. LY-1074]MDR5707103.1 D-glycero-beta-D-manno-heptose 1-phosphate adenylyltransferase [Agromyces sp. LY-1358]